MNFREIVYWGFVLKYADKIQGIWSLTKITDALEQWFPKWAVPPPGGRWDYRGGR
jgi:hypothetical protein